VAVTSDSQGEEKQEEKEARRGRKVARRGDGWRDLARPRVAPCARSIPLAETRFLPFYPADLDSFGRMAGRPLNARIFIRFLVAEKARPGLRREESTAPASIAPKVARFLFGRPGIAGNPRESSKQSYAGCSPRRRATGSFCPREKGLPFPAFHQLVVSPLCNAISRPRLSLRRIVLRFHPLLSLSLSLSLPASRCRPILMTNAAGISEISRGSSRGAD